MAEALYRKYRPQTFEDVVGQTHIERTLKNAIESDKVSHAYLFCGPRGTGKTTTARILAKALLCEHGPTPAPDGTCDQCLEIAEGTHPDVNELDAASRTGVENVREEIIGRVQYAPTRGRYKVYIIDEVHMLTVAAFNALLKTLEEPPSHVVFVLCTTDPQKVPETIHSRCQRFDFHRLSNEEIVSRLAAVCDAEGVQYETPALELVAGRARGGMRDALTTLEQLIAFGNGAVTSDVAQSVFGTVGADEVPALVDSIAARDAAACFTWLSDYIETGADLGRFAQELAGYIRNLYVLALTGGAMAVDAPEAARAAMAEQAKRFGHDRLAYMLRVLGDAMTELRTAGNPRLSFEIALTRMVRPDSDLTIEALAARVEALEKAIASGVAVSSAPAAQPAGQSVPAAPVVSCREGSAVPSSARRVDSSPSQGFARDGAEPSASTQARDSSSRPVPRPAAVPPQPSSSANVAAVMDKVAAARARFEGIHAKNAALRKDSPAGQAAFAAASAPSAAPAAMAANPSSVSTAAPAPSSTAPAATPADSSPVPAASAPAAQSGVSDEVRAKLANESAFNQCWQSVIAELKRRRAAHAALLLSARGYAAPDASKVFVEFPKGNSFAWSAANRPEYMSALAEAFRAVFGADVPFEMVQGVGASPASTFASFAAPAAPAPSAPAPAAPTPSAPVEEQVPYDDADVVPYTDDDVVPYTDADYAYYVDDEPLPAAAPMDARMPSAPGGADPFASSAAPAPIDSSAAAAPERAAVSDESVAPANSQVADASAATSSPSEDAEDQGPVAPRVDLSVTGPEPVDPYLVGKKLGFDSMPSPKRRRKGMFKPKGWPMRGDAVEPSDAGFGDGDAPEVFSPAASADSAAKVERSAETAATSVLEHGAIAHDQAKSKGNTCDSPATSRSAAPVVSPAPAAPVAPHVPAVSAASPAPAASAAPPAPPASAIDDFAPACAPAGPEMDVFEIFGAFGVAPESVKEER